MTLNRELRDGLLNLLDTPLDCEEDVEVFGDSYPRTG
jgi:hypothetical protein